MSFLAGLTSLGKSTVSFFGTNSVASSLVKTAVIGYALNRMTKSANKGNDIGQEANIDQGVRLQVPPAADHKIPVLYGAAYFGGIITDVQMTNNNRTMTYCMTLAQTPVAKGFAKDPIEVSSVNVVYKNIYWNDQRVVFQGDGVTVDYTVDRASNIDRSLSGLVKIYCYKNGRTSGTLVEGQGSGTVPAANTVMPGWTLNHQMANLSFAIIQVNYNRERNVVGIGDLLFHIDTDIKNPADVLYDYMTDGRYGAGITASDIDIVSLNQLYNYSNESLSYDDQNQLGVQTLADRYQINGLIDTAKPVLENIEKICSAAASWLTYDVQEGKWSIVINRAGDPIATFNDSNILGNITLSGTGLQDLYNSVKVEFPHRDLKDSADFVKIDIASGDRNLNEEDNTLNLSYDIINEPIQAQILGLIELKQSRIDLIIQFQTDYSNINLKAGDIISVSNDRFSFNGRPFRIITISEVQNDDGALVMEIIALEYNGNVYSTNDLYRFFRTDQNGIITIGSIGIPGTPVVNKVEIDARPRIVTTTTSPTGVVEGIEFWLTNDVSSAEPQRSYRLIGTRVPAGGGVFPSGTSVTFEYDSINASNFFIKTRGFNARTVGGFSEPSGLVEFTPTQVTNAIGPNTQVLDSTGQLITAIAAIELLKKLDDLFLGGAASKSLFDALFDAFKVLTGIDLVGDASEGDLVVAAQVAVRDSAGATVTLPTDSINFTNSAFLVGGVGNAATVGIDPDRIFSEGEMEDWTTDSSVTEIVVVQGIGIERFNSITFARPSGHKVTLNIEWPEEPPAP